MANDWSWSDRHRRGPTMANNWSWSNRHWRGPTMANNWSWSTAKGEAPPWQITGAGVIAKGDVVPWQINNLYHRTLRGLTAIAMFVLIVVRFGPKTSKSTKHHSSQTPTISFA